MPETLTDQFHFEWIYWVLVVAYAVTVLSVVGVMLSENRNPVKTLAWMTVLLVVPVLGLVLYLLFGRSIKNKKFMSRRRRRKLKRHEPARPFSPSETGLSHESNQLIHLGQSLMSAPFYQGNSAIHFADGQTKMEALIDDIKKAKRFIYLQYYIFQDDEIGSRLAELLIQKAREGLDVKVIYDHVGSFKTKRRFFKRMADAGIGVYPFFKVTFPILGTRINWRNHRKIAIIDGNIGYIGGMNIADRYVNGWKHGIWRDAHIRVEGPIIKSLNHSFAIDWNYSRQVDIRDVNRAFPSEHLDNWGMQLITSGPTGQWSNLLMMFQKAIGNAKQSVWIQTPYFLPSESLLRALQSAALAKVDVRLMIPLNPDSAMLRYASFSFVKECLQSGIKVYLYQPGMLHSKMMIIDNELVTVGSTNFDFRSFEHNFEGNLFIYSQEFNRQMREQFLADQAESRRVIPFEWQRRARSKKLLESLTRIFSPIL